MTFLNMYCILGNYKVGPNKYLSPDPKRRERPVCSRASKWALERGSCLIFDGDTTTSISSMDKQSLYRECTRVLNYLVLEHPRMTGPDLVDLGV